MIGINDIWHPFWRENPHQIDDVLHAFNQLVGQLKKQADVVIVLEPVALPCGEVTQHWWPLLSDLSEGQQKICNENQVHWLPLQNELLKDAEGKVIDYLGDGVHPTDLGHRWLAKQWIGYVVEHKLLEGV